MRKTLLIMAAAFTLAACKEKETTAVDSEVIETTAPENAVVVGDTTATAVNPQVAAQEDLIREAQSKPLTTLALSENHHEFGKVKKGNKVSHDYTVTNTGTNPLIISQVKPGCGCTAPDFTKEPIMPGKTGKITLSFDSTNIDGMQNKQAEVFANVEKAPVLLTFSAEVQP